jgi:DNA repair photolyase
MKQLKIAGHELPAALRQVVDYRKSGLSLNHVVGCPLDCGYCVRHLFDNFDMKKPHLIMSDQKAIETLVGHWAFQAHRTPIQIFNRATDPFLPTVKDHLFRCLESLDGRGLRNPVLVITRWHVLPEDVGRLAGLKNLRVTVLVTWSGIEDAKIEPVDCAIAEESLRILANEKGRVRSILYWRPIVAGFNDGDEHIAKARELAALADATVFTGLFYRNEIRDYFKSIGVPDLYDDVARRKILPQAVEAKIIAAFDSLPIFRKTSCGIAYAHGIPDYNGHYGIREICDICPSAQLEVCRDAHRVPDAAEIYALALKASLDTGQITWDDRRVEVAGSQEQQRYFMQHSLNFQVHDRNQPHHYGRHGKADIGWT